MTYGPGPKPAGAFFMVSPTSSSSAQLCPRSRGDGMAGPQPTAWQQPPKFKAPHLLASLSARKSHQGLEVQTPDAGHLWQARWEQGSSSGS